MAEVVVYVLRDRLVSGGGSGWKAILKDMLKAGIINSFSEAIEIRFDKDKALHLQAVLEFHDVNDAIPKGAKERK
jgi:hypothetical protein